MREPSRPSSASGWAGERVDGAALVEPHGLVLERGEVAHQRVGRAHVCDLLQRAAHFVVELGGVDIEGRAALARHQREGKRERRMRHVGAADVESPGDILRVRHHQGVGAELGEFAADALELVGGALAGKLEIAQRDQSRRRRRPFAPQRVDRVAVDGDEFCAGHGAGLAQLLGAFGRVQPGIVAEPGAGGEVALQPFVRRHLHQMLDGEDRAVHLCVRLHGIAPVGEQYRAVGEHDGEAGRAGEAGQPGEPLLARWQIFVLLAVGARHRQAVEPAPLELGAQRGDASGALRAFARIIEGLEAGLEHGRHSNVLLRPSNAGMRHTPGAMRPGVWVENLHRLASNTAMNRPSDSSLCSALYSPQ